MLSLTARCIEALLFVASDPVTEEELSSVLCVTVDDVKEAMEELVEHYSDHHSLALIRVCSGWRMATEDRMAGIISSFRETSQKQRVRLSKASLETLAVVAFDQPVTRAEIEEIRGVRCDRVIETLLSHGLIKVAGRKPGTGTPLLYRTTDKFLEKFGLNSISDLPTLEEIREMSLEMEERDVDEESQT